MSGKTPVECLLCEKKFVVRDLLEHIHQDIGYLPHKCGSCDFETSQQSDVDAHRVENDHEPAPPAFNAYKEWLVQSINSDIIYAHRHGTEALLEAKKKNGASITTSPSIVQPTSSAHVTPMMRRREQQPPLPIQAYPSEDEEERAAPSSSRIAPKRLNEEEDMRREKRKREEEEVRRVQNASVQQSRVVQRPPPASFPHKQKVNPPPMIEEPCDKDLEPLIRESKKFAECQLCREKVNIMLSSRQEHVERNHLSNEERAMKREVYVMKLEKQTSLAFPGLNFSREKCSACFLTIKSNTGRISHVCNKHLNYSSIRCPICGWTTKIMGDINSHLEKSHALTGGRRSLVEDKFADFRRDFDKYKIKVIKMANYLFPVEFDVDTKEKKKKPTEEDDDEDFDVNEIMRNAPPKRDTPPVRSMQYRRSQSPEVTSDEEEDDDKPAKRGNGEREKIVIRKKDGSTMLVEASDNEGEEEDGYAGSDMDIEDGSEEGRSYVTGSSSVLSTIAGSESDLKRETSTPDVKADDEEVKKEPETPRRNDERPMWREFSGRSSGMYSRGGRVQQMHRHY